MILPTATVKRRAMERTLLEWLRQKLPATERLPLGLSDDAALLRLTQAGDCVITTDMLCDGVHFNVDDLPLEQIGRKAIAVNLSDLAAMAATPVSAFVSIAVPRAWERANVERLYAGMMQLADEFDCPLAGGDTNRWDGRLVLNVVALGLPPAGGVWRRSGGQLGDWLLVTGELGGSILEHHYTFQPRVREARQLASEYSINAALDISDGLALDASRLAEASGQGVLIDLNAIPVSAAAMQRANEAGYTESPTTFALSDGEDFELLLSLAPAEAERLLSDQPLAVPLTRVGELIDEKGTWQLDETGQRHPLEATGYLHE